MDQILLIEDDRYLSMGLRELLEKNGYAVQAADSLGAAREALLAGTFSLVILDVVLPDGDGVSFCAALRQEGFAAPILFLTARDEEYDVVRGLDAGGNDYVAKPFRVQELLSRIRVLLRRQPTGSLSLGALRLDPERMSAVWNGAPLNLTPMEFRLLSVIVRRRGIAPRALLLDVLWDCDGRFVDDNTLSVHVSRLREKIGAEHIQTVRGLGYRWKD